MYRDALKSSPLLQCCGNNIRDRKREKEEKKTKRKEKKNVMHSNHVPFYSAAGTIARQKTCAQLSSRAAKSGPRSALRPKAVIRCAMRVTNGGTALPIRSCRPACT